MAIPCAIMAITPSLASAQNTTVVSLSSAGVQANWDCFYPTISADGRYIAFFSAATNLVPGDTNNFSDVFVRDRQTSQTTRVSVSSSGAQGDGNAGNIQDDRPALSSDGRYVAFASSASNLVPSDTNNADDVFLHDRQTAQTTRVSVATGGGQGNGASYYPAMSADGRYIAFESYATILVPNDNNGSRDIFVQDRQTGSTIRVSVSSSGLEANNDSDNPSISADGRYIAFSSYANNLVPGDTNNQSDIFIYDQQTAQTTRVSLASGGNQGSGSSYFPSLSADGRLVSFNSTAGNLVPNDNNGLGDVFVRDILAGQTTRASVASDGSEGNGASIYSSISGDGRFVGFHSQSSNIAPPNDPFGFYDVFVHDRQTGQTTCLSVSPSGAAGAGVSFWPSLSFDGRLVAFESQASNLVPSDANFFYDVFLRDLGPLCAPADINCDGHVNVDDLLAVINGWGACPPPCPPYCAGDINHNCVVNVDDLLAVINGWAP